MSFLGDMINKLTHQNQESSQGQQGGYNAGQQRQQFQPQQPGFPQVQPPWIARWDNNRGTWFYFNEQTGEQSLQHPSTRGYAGTQGYGGNNQTYQGVQQQQQQQPYQGEPRKHGYGGIAMGAAAGVVGGAALMYGAHEIRMQSNSFLAL